MSFSKTIFLTAILGAMAVADAEAQRRGGDADNNPTITLYDQPNFQGRSITLDGDAPDLRWVQFNDLATSWDVSGGEWEVCLEPNFRGNCHIIGEEMPDMGPWAFNNRITSVRALHRRDRDRRRGITLYSGRNYTGQSVRIRDVEFDLRDLRFDNRAQSIEVHSGTWTLCENRSFSGRCVEFSRDSNDLKLFRMDGRISAASPEGIPRPEPAPIGGPGYGDSFTGAGESGAVRGVNSLFIPAPQSRGYAIAVCEYSRGVNCGEPVADRICRSEGFGRAAHFDSRRSRSTLWFIGDRAARGGRDEIVDVLCVR